MLTPEQIERLPEATLDAFAKLEEALRSEAVASLSAEGADKAAVRAALAARSHGMKRDIEATIAATVRDAARASLLTDEAAYEVARAAGIIAPYAALTESAVFGTLLKDGIATAVSLGNIVRTSAEQVVFNEFADALDSALLSIVSGVESPQAAIRKAVDSIARTETKFRYVQPGGKVIERGIYSSVRSNLITASNQVTMRLQEARLREVGADYVEISAHIGARPDHAEWQGSVMRFDELPAATGYGEADGLGGVNCRHSWMPYFPGIMEPTDYGYLQDDEEMARQYELSQRQRTCERNIRTYQSRANIYAAAGETAEARRNRALATKWRREADTVAEQRNGARRRDREAASAAR